MIRGALLAVLLAATVTLPSRSHASQSARSGTRGYAQQIHALRVQLDREAARAVPNHRAVRAVKRGLTHLVSARVAGGTIRTDAPRLAGQLDPNSVASVRAVSIQLDALDDGLQAAGAVRAVPGSRAALTAAYADPRFHPRCAWLDCLGVWIDDHITDPLTSLLFGLLNRMQVSLDLTPAVSIISVALVVGLVVAIGFLAIRGTLRQATELAAAQAETTVAPAGEDPWARARDLRAGGDTRQAFRYLFLAMMLELQRQGAIVLRPGWTNRDHLAAVQEKVELAGLRRLVDAFDRTWYGHQPLDRDEYDALARLVSDLTQRVRSAA